MSFAALWKARSEGVPSGSARRAPTSNVYAPLPLGGARPAMGGVPTPVSSLAAGLVPRPAPAAVAVPSPVLAPAVAAPPPQQGSLLALMRARAMPAADRPGEVAGVAVSSRPVRASTISGESTRPLTTKGRVTFSKRDQGGFLSGP